jgi:hypothetical protein
LALRVWLLTRYRRLSGYRSTCLRRYGLLLCARHWLGSRSLLLRHRALLLLSHLPLRTLTHMLRATIALLLLTIPERTRLARFTRLTRLESTLLALLRTSITLGRASLTLRALRTVRTLVPVFTGRESRSRPLWSLFWLRFCSYRCISILCNLQRLGGSGISRALFATLLCTGYISPFGSYSTIYGLLYSFRRSRNFCGRSSCSLRGTSSTLLRFCGSTIFRRRSFCRCSNGLNRSGFSNWRRFFCLRLTRRTCFLGCPIGSRIGPTALHSSQGLLIEDLIDKGLLVKTCGIRYAEVFGYIYKLGNDHVVQLVQIVRHQMTFGKNKKEKKYSV